MTNDQRPKSKVINIDTLSFVFSRSDMKRHSTFRHLLTAILIILTLGVHGQGIVAHRGFWKADGAQQNSLVAFMAAYHAAVCAGVECDARLTADSVLVIIHDRKIGNEYVDQIPYSRVARYRLPNGESIPTAEEYLQQAAQYCSENFKLFFEIKPARSDDERQTYVAKCTELVRRYKMEGRLEFISFDLEMCKMLAERCPDIPVAYLEGDRTPEELHAWGIDGIDYRYGILFLHPDWIQQAHNLGMSVNAWTVDDKATAQVLSLLGVDLITTNEPRRMPAWLHDEPVFTFVSFNIRQSGFASYDEGNAWPYRKEAVAKMLLALAPDAFGVQEMLPDQRDFLRQNLKEYRMLGVGRDDGDQEGENMAIFYNKKRFKLLQGKTYWLSETPDTVSFGWDAACRRTVTKAVLQDKKTKVVIHYYNTHLDHVGTVARSESVKLLCRLMDEDLGKGIPVLLGGDMNSSMADTIFIPLLRKGMLPVRDLTPQTDQEPSFNGYGIQGNAFANNRGEHVIDQFFARNIYAIQFKTLVEYFGVPYISDHYPVWIQFSVSQAPNDVILSTKK